VSEADARAHYDDTGTVAAFVRAGEDRHGIWVAGALRSDLPVEKRRDLLANPPSGDWRNGELIAIHAVPTPGYAVPRVAVAASAAIFSTGLTPVGPENEGPAGDRRARRVRAAAASPVRAARTRPLNLVARIQHHPARAHLIAPLLDQLSGLDVELV
jgi:hypothetical protein